MVVKMVRSRHEAIDGHLSDVVVLSVVWFFGVWMMKSNVCHIKTH